MQSRDILADAFERIHQLVHVSAVGLTADELAHRPETEANSIAWLIWHLTRIQDDHVAELAGREQAWVEGRWAQDLGMSADSTDTGYGHTTAQVAAVRPEGPDALLGYHDLVHDRTLQYVGGVDADALDRLIDYSYDPPISTGVRLVSVISDNLEHAGQARYLRGIVDRSR